MKFPYVIDNISTRLADVLNKLLSHQPGQQFDVATAYFSIRGFQQVRQTLPTVGRFRLLIGDEPKTADHIGLRPDSAAFLRHELNSEPLAEATRLLVEELIRFLRREDVAVRLYLGHEPGRNGRRQFLHAKCYLFYGGIGSQLAFSGFLNPLVGIVGSSNFTAPGLTTNRELNLVHKTVLTEDEVVDKKTRDEVTRHAKKQVNPNITPDNQQLLKSEVGAGAIDDLVTWYDSQWEMAVDYKAELIELLENSKFGGREYTPYEIYMKALYE